MKGVSVQASLEISHDLMYQNKTSKLYISILSDKAMTAQHKVKKEFSSWWSISNEGVP